MRKPTEILAPAGSMDALKAAVRCGGNAVYLGGSGLNARQTAQNFDKTLLKEAVSYCHARGVRVHQTLNTIVFENELKLAEELIKEATEAGIDAFIIQDLGVLELAKSCAPTIERHGSTQMAVHSLAGVLELAELGFSRVVLARELTIEEIEHILQHSPIEVECFVHGALCMSVSGQCYLSSMIGGRSGNRGRCAQPCRLPFASKTASHALSLKDLSVIEYIPELYRLGVTSFKIEGRLKRPEYVAAVVTACKQVLAGEKIDYDILQSVFSRSGFTDGYVENQLGDNMFGTKTEKDTASDKLLKELALLYKAETPLVGVAASFTMTSAQTLLTMSAGGKTVTVKGQPPEKAISAPTTREKVEQALSKTGGTPFFLNSLDWQSEEGLMLPVSQLNALRRRGLDELLLQLGQVEPKEFKPYNWEKLVTEKNAVPKLIGRFASADQLWSGSEQAFDKLIIPLNEGIKLANNTKSIILELDDLVFSLEGQAREKQSLETAKALGFGEVMVGNLGSLHLAKELGFVIHGNFNLNVVNSLSAREYAKLGLKTVTMSIEYPVHGGEPKAELEKGIIVYGTLPMMSFRNTPAGMEGSDGELTDRLGNKFLTARENEISVMYNSVPLYLLDQLEKYGSFGFHTLYYTGENRAECKAIFEAYRQGKKPVGEFTRGLYRRKVE